MAVMDPPVMWTGMAMKWIGWDGSEWSLSDTSTGTVMLPGVRGLSMPPVIHHRAAHASLAGARWRGHTVDVREVFWPLQVFSDVGSMDWAARDRAFWKSLNPSKTGQWIVSLPDGSSRKLTLRLVNDSEYSMTTDSSLSGWSNYGITLAAEQPFWEAEPVEGIWQPGADSAFFPGPSFTISPKNTVTVATLENPGDVPAHVVWRVYGPVDNATVGVNGRNIVVPFAIPDGEVLEINTHPSVQTAMQGPVAGPLTTDKTMNLGSIDFAPLPESSTSSLSLTISGGTGKITATFNPLYYRAW